MFLTGIIGFLLGCLVPAIASRFGKILPADPGLILVQMWHKPVLTKSQNPKRNQQLKKMWQKFFIISLLWGVFNALCFIANGIIFQGGAFIVGCAFVYMVSLLMSVDKMYYLLPDFFTIPLLVLGFTFVYCFKTPITMEEALIGAWYGYFVSVVSVVVMSFFKTAEFGAGDAKMLTALGAWLGLVGLSIVIVLSFVFFSIEALILKRRSGAFGPALGSAALIVFYLLFSSGHL